MPIGISVTLTVITLFVAVTFVTVRDATKVCVDAMVQVPIKDVAVGIN